MNRYRLVVFEEHFKSIDCSGEWDGCYYSYWGWEIYNQHGEIVKSGSGYHNETQARYTGEITLQKLNGYESDTKKQ